jgi:nitroimidazol reductase NimA-like FMN-containing flavoprotein (pyridoxamine 5'-phosphate oxidase superfamily)
MDEDVGDAAMRVLDESECWARLSSVPVGRLAFVVAGEVEIFPVNYVVDGRAIVFRTAQGTKLAGLALAGPVAFEVDGFDPASGVVWSVIAKGQAHRLDRSDELEHADQLDLRPWLPSLKPFFVRLEHLTVTGRAFPHPS